MTVYSPDYWQPRIASLLASTPKYAGIDPRFVRAWNRFESDGQPCACSASGGKLLLGADGNPREIGLGQLYNAPDGTSDDFTEQGLHPGALRAYCGAPTSFESASTVQRPLTDAEEAEQVEALLDLVLFGKQQADIAVKRFGLQWPGADYWCLVKATHALEGILKLGLPAVVQKLGRAPTGWGEFRRVLGMERDPQWVSGLNACEKLASAVGTVTLAGPPAGSSGGGGGFVVLAVLWLLSKLL